MGTVISTSPHIRSRENISSIMCATAIALLPAGFAGVFFFGYYSGVVIIVSILSCILMEFISQKILGKDVAFDGSAVITGLLLAYVMPPTVPLWLVVIGSVVAIFLVKHLFGGLGYNIFNPALAARAVLLASWPQEMTTWQWKYGYKNKLIDTITTATPLGIKKLHVSSTYLNNISYLDMFIGKIPGCIGEVSKIMLLIGAAYLLARGIITLHVPLSYILTVSTLSFISGRDVLFDILSGGLILGAFFMATDYVTSPISRQGKIIFGVGCGIITMLIRLFGGFPEGVCYSILFMNCFTPLIDKYVRDRKFGE
jgi:electron transport complex protein RnfD